MWSYELDVLYATFVGVIYFQSEKHYYKANVYMNSSSALRNNCNLNLSWEQQGC